MIIFASVVFGVSVVGSIFLLTKRMRTASKMSEPQLRYLLIKEPPLSLQVWYALRHIIQIFWFRYCRDMLFMFIVKQISHIRIIVLRIEQNLFRIGRSVRERGARQKPSLYWRDLQGWHKATRWHKKKNKETQPEKHIVIREYVADELSSVEISRK